MHLNFSALAHGLAHRLEFFDGLVLGNPTFVLVGQLPVELLKVGPGRVSIRG